MFRGFLLFTALAGLAAPASASQFAISGRATGYMYTARPAGYDCDQAWCQSETPMSMEFSYVLDPITSDIFPNGYREYAPGIFEFVIQGGKLSSNRGTFVRTPTGFMGTAYQYSEAWLYCPPGIGCGIALTASSFAVREIGGASAVPEPSTWAMLIAGLGVVGAAIRRRRQHGPLQLA